MLIFFSKDSQCIPNAPNFFASVVVKMQPVTPDLTANPFDLIGIFPLVLLHTSGLPLVSLLKAWPS